MVKYDLEYEKNNIHTYPTRFHPCFKHNDLTSRVHGVGQRAMNTTRSLLFTPSEIDMVLARWPTTQVTRGSECFFDVNTYTVLSALITILVLLVIANLTSALRGYACEMLKPYKIWERRRLLNWIQSSQQGGASMTYRDGATWCCRRPDHAGRSHTRHTQIRSLSTDGCWIMGGLEVGPEPRTKRRKAIAVN